MKLKLSDDSLSQTEARLLRAKSGVRAESNESSTRSSGVDSKSKLRPAAIVADAGRGDWLLCQITSKPYGDACAIRLAGESFKKGSLRVESFVRPGKLFTASVNLFLTEVGSLKQSSIQQILKGIADLFRPPGELEERVPQSAQKVEALVRAKEFSTMTKSTKPFWLCCISASMRESAHGKALIG